MKLKAWMTLVKLLLLLRGSHLPEARPSSVCHLSAAQLGTCVHKLLEQRQVSSAPQLTPNLLTTGLPQLPHTAEGWQRVRSRNRLPVPTGFKDRKVTFLISKRKMSGLQTIASDRGGGGKGIKCSWEYLWQSNCYIFYRLTQDVTNTQCAAQESSFQGLLWSLFLLELKCGHFFLSSF